MAGQWVDLQTAAEHLGISTEAVRKRASRGSLDSRKAEDGRVYVRVDDDRTRRPGDDSSELVEVLRDEISHLRRESERKDTILMQLSQANAEQARTIRALEAPESREAGAHAPAEAEEGRGPARGEAERATERPWWRRVFGG